MTEWRWLRQMTLRLRALFLRGRVERELEEEFRFHLESRIEMEMARGLSPEEARSAAVRAMDGMEQHKEECRDRRRVNCIDDFLRDLRHAGRSLRRSRGFAALAVVIMALGIGGNTAVFSLVNQLLLHPPGVSEPQRIVVLRMKYDKLNLDLEQASPPALADARANQQVFEHAGAARPASFNYADRAVPVRLPGAAVSVGWFDVFGAKPALGRAFSADEDQPGANRVVVLAHEAWLRLFGADPDVVGRTMELNQQPYKIIGVMARVFTSRALWIFGCRWRCRRALSHHRTGLTEPFPSWLGPGPRSLSPKPTAGSSGERSASQRPRRPICAGLSGTGDGACGHPVSPTRMPEIQKRRC
jgi:hypothetical protein